MAFLLPLITIFMSLTHGANPFELYQIVKRLYRSPCITYSVRSASRVTRYHIGRANLCSYCFASLTLYV